MGGNVDYTGGMVLQGLVAEGVLVTAQMRRDNAVVLHNPGAAEYAWLTGAEFDFSDIDSADALRRRCQSDPRLHWTAYIVGGLHFLRRKGFGFGQRGIQILVESNLPPNKGVSSSAALALASLKAVSAAWGACLNGRELAEAGQWVENEIVRSACGIMDHAAIVFGQQDELIPLLCQPLSVGTGIPLPAGMRLWGIDSMVPRATSSVAYNRARAAAFMAYKILCDQDCLKVVLDTTGSLPRYSDSRWNGYLSNLEPADFVAKYESSLPWALSGKSFLGQCAPHVDPFTSITPHLIYPVRGAARYAIYEHQRVQSFAELLAMDPPRTSAQAEQQLLALGDLMAKSHHAYRETGLASTDCDEIVSMVQQAGPERGLYGAKMTGGGGGGTVVILGTPQGEASVVRIAKEYGDRHGVTPYLFMGSSPGTDAAEQMFASTFRQVL